MANSPVKFLWDGEVMKPLNPQRADQAYVVGVVYPLAIYEDRSAASHNHYFAAVHEAWKNLPEKLSGEYPTSEHLRKRALIRCGYYDMREIVCTSPSEAVKVKSFIKPMDEYAVVISKDVVVRVYTAKSQSPHAMNKEEFQKSKQDVLDDLAGLIETDTKTLVANAGKAA